MDKMEQWEIQELFNLLEYVDIQAWNRMRMLYYVVVQVNSKRQIDPKKLFPLPWDITEKPKTAKEIEFERKKLLENIDKYRETAKQVK